MVVGRVGKRKVEENAAKYELPYQVIFDKLRPTTEDGPGQPLFQVRRMAWRRPRAPVPVSLTT